jgi:hypothetical protein
MESQRYEAQSYLDLGEEGHLRQGNFRDRGLRGIYAVACHPWAAFGHTGFVGRPLYFRVAERGVRIGDP